jgi:hypothetical protein
MLRTQRINQDPDKNIMKLILEINFHDFFNRLIDRIKKWLKQDGELLGHIVAVFHFMIFGVLLTLVFISHTVYPSVWMKLAIFLGLGAIFLQHVVFDACIVSVWEQNLTKSELTPFHSVLEKILKIFNITLSQYDKYLLVIEGVAVACFGLELLSHFSVYLHTVDWNELLVRAWHQTKLNIA